MKIGLKKLSMAMGLFIALSSSYADAAMSYDEALTYQQQYNKEIYVQNTKLRENDRKTVLHRTFNLFKKKGNSNDFGKWGQGLAKAQLNLALDYGLAEKEEIPLVFIGWSYEGPSHSVGYMPSNMTVTFLDGYTLTLNCNRQGNYYEADGWVVSDEFGDYPKTRYRGRIYLTIDELQLIAEHGEIDSVNIDGNRKLLYDLPKQAKERKIFETGIKHAVKILELK